MPEDEVIVFEPRNMDQKNLHKVLAIYFTPAKLRSRHDLNPYLSYTTGAEEARENL